VYQKLWQQSRHAVAVGRATARVRARRCTGGSTGQPASGCRESRRDVWRTSALQVKWHGSDAVAAAGVLRSKARCGSKRWFLWAVSDSDERSNLCACGMLQATAAGVR
jgi:hypothetical protein